MDFSTSDAGRLLLAALMGGVVLLLPGAALARAFRHQGANEEADLASAALFGCALLPGILSLATRLIGLDAAIAIDLALGLGGLAGLRARRPTRPVPAALVLALAWLAVVLVEWIDVDGGTTLFQPLIVYDTVKHAATTQAIVESGAPPRDAFFFRPERSSYYYYFYTLPALMVRLSGGFVDARAAVGGLVFWTGLGVVGLLELTLRRAGLSPRLSAERRPLLLAAVLAIGGLDILMVLRHAWAKGEWYADPLHWNEQVGAWFENILWVPHHVTALMAGILALAGLSRAIGERGEAPAAAKTLLEPVGLAAIALAAMFGLSVWLSLAFAASIGVWAARLALVERRWRALLPIAIAGGTALLLCLPQLHDLAAGRTAGPFPIAPTVRLFAPLEGVVAPGFWTYLARAVCLPLNYLIGFGALAFGTLAFWRARRSDTIPGGGEFGRALALAAATGLLVASFLRSTLYNNDLGWRAMLLPLLAATAWTIAVLDRWLADRRDPAVAGLMSPVFAATCGLGAATVLYAAVMMRAYPLVPLDGDLRFMAQDPEGQRALRVAFRWANDHLPPGRVVQQNPAVARAFAFGLYGRHATGVSDSFGSLYGADPREVERRLAAVADIFTTRLDDGEIARRAAAQGIDDLVVTASDPVWADPQSFVWRKPPLFAATGVRVFATAAMEAAR